jgi:hypothetical protein
MLAPPGGFDTGLNSFEYLQQPIVYVQAVPASQQLFAFLLDSNRGSLVLSNFKNQNFQHGFIDESARFFHGPFVYLHEQISGQLVEIIFQPVFF